MSNPSFKDSGPIVIEPTYKFILRDKYFYYGNGSNPQLTYKGILTFLKELLFGVPKEKIPFDLDYTLKRKQYTNDTFSFKGETYQGYRKGFVVVLLIGSETHICHQLGHGETIKRTIKIDNIERDLDGWMYHFSTI